MASPAISVTPTRTSGVAPLGVVFDATGTTDSDVTSVFRDLYYAINFGDSASGSWAYGATAGPKNFAKGAVAGHVYETAGTYTWTMVVWDGTTADVATGTITVTDWADDANTVCVGNVLPVAGVNGVPDNATCVASSDFDDAIATYLTTGKRVLFQRGDTFAASTTASVAASGVMAIGAFGTGAAPVVTSTNIGGVININNTAVNDLRVLDIDLTGNGATDTGVAISVGAAVDNITLLRVNAYDIGAGFVVQSGSSVTGGVVQECSVYDYYDSSGGNAVFGNWQSSAFLGNLFGAADSGAEHVMRLQPGFKVAICSNTLTTPATSKMVLTIRALVHSTSADDTQYVYVNDNKLIGGIYAWTVQIAPAADTEDARIYDVICDGNWLTSGASTTTGFIVTATRTTIRNNLIDLSGASSFTGVNVNYTNTGGAPTTADTWILNNTMYSSDEAGTAYGVSVDTEPTGTVILNNLVYAPTAAAGDMILGTGTTPGAMTNNSSDAQINGTDPAFDGPLTTPAGFRISTSSYADAGGTASFPAQNRDFYNCEDKTGDNRIGALVAAANRQCYGVAQ